MRIDDEISRRLAGDGDVPFLKRLFGAVRTEMFAALPDYAVAPLLEIQFNAQAAQYRLDYPHAEAWIVERDGDPVGNLLLAADARSIRIVDINVLPAFQNKGIGGRVIQSVMSAADRPVSLSVFVSNPARRLYERLGFREVETVGIYVRMERAAPPSG